MRSRDRDQYALFANVYPTQPMRDRNRHELMLLVYVASYGHEGAQRKRSVGGVSEVGDGLGLEVVACATYIYIYLACRLLSVRAVLDLYFAIHTCE